MPAPNIATLFDFESPYEDALRNYFLNVNVGGFQFAQVTTPRTNIAGASELVTPRLQIRCGLTGLAPQGSGVNEEFAPNLGQYYAYYTMGCALDVVTSRSNNSQPHGLYRGATRQGMLGVTAALNSNTVPYFQTVFMNPIGSVQSVDDSNDEIWTQLTYSWDFFIPPTSVP